MSYTGITKPVLDVKTRVVGKTHDIYHCLLQHELESPGLLAGKTGTALFLFHYAKLFEDNHAYKRAQELLYNVYDEIESGYNYFSFANGLAGIGWALCYFSEQGFIDRPGKGSLEQLGEYLFQEMIREMLNGHFDYLHGAAGLPLFWLKLKNEKGARNYVEDFVELLDDSKEEYVPGNYRWKSIINHETGEKGYNIALSHGLSSLLAILSKIQASGIADVNRLLKGITNYILSQQFELNKMDSVFPTFSLDSEKELNASRLAWCYGDPGIGIALYQAAVISGNESLQKHAIDVMANASIRRDPEMNRVFDAGLCHGSSGLAVIFNRMYQNTKLSYFSDARDHWIKVALDQASFEDGLAGYKRYISGGKEQWLNSVSLLEGICGTGLMFISYLSGGDADWDEILLLH